MMTAALAQRSMRGAITAFWALFRADLPFLPAEPVTEEAFCIARKKLKLGFFRTVFQTVIRRYQQRFDHAYRWQGFRLLGIDGMKLTLPPSPKLKHYFTTAANQQGAGSSAQGLLVGLVGLWNGVCYGFKLTSGKGSEQACARKLIRRQVGASDLLMCDRNFPDYHTLALLQSRGAHYLFHLQANRYTTLPARATASGRPEEWYVDLPIPPRLAEDPSELPATLTARILRYQRIGFRPSWLITSLLDTAGYPYEELVSLYHERWRQETMHREWKYSLSLSRLRSVSVPGIFKEVYVQLTLNNVVRWLMSDGADQGHCRPVDLKFLDCKRLILSSVSALSAVAPQIMPKLYQRLIVELSTQKICFRPGRRYPRRNDFRLRNKGHGKQVLPAQLLPTERRAM